MPKMVEQFGITDPFHIGIYIAAVGLLAGGTSVVYGRIREKLSYKAIVLISLALWVVGFAAIYQAFSIWLVWLAIALFGIGMGISMPTIPVWVGDLVPASYRGRMTSYIATFGYTGQFLSPVILSPVESSLGLNNVFLIVAAACALLFLLYLVFLRK